MEDKIYELAKRIKEAGRIIAKDDIYKDYYIDGNRSDDTIIVTSDSGYEAIYIGNTFSDSKKSYMCLYTNNASKRNSYPSTKEIARLLVRVAKGEKLPEGEGKAAYFHCEKDDLQKQLKYFAEVVCKMAGIGVPDYELTEATVEDEEYIYSDAHTAERGYIGRLRGDFGKDGMQFWSAWENGNDALNTVEFRTEFDDLIHYLKEKAYLPLLKNRAVMQHICQNADGFKLKDKFADIYLFKVITEKYTYFIRCFYGVGDYNFYIFAYNNEKLRKYQDIQLVEKHSGVLDRDKFFKTDSGFTYVYYNPDATAGGQFVYNEISYGLIWDALVDDINSDNFFDYIQSHCKQYLVDLGDSDFHDSVMNFVNNKAAFEGCTEDTMHLLQDAAQRDLYSYSVDDNNVMTIWEGSTIMCTISDVKAEIADTLFHETVFEMRGISIDDLKYGAKEVAGEIKLLKKAIGSINFTDGLVDITDPSYESDIWCRMNNVSIKAGQYNCYAYICVEGDSYDMGRCFISRIEHKDYDIKDIPNGSWKKISNIGVDAGRAGFFSHKIDLDADEWMQFCDEIQGKNYMIMNGICKGFCTSSGYGDGYYDVYAYYRKGEIVALEIRY